MFKLKNISDVYNKIICKNKVTFQENQIDVVLLPQYTQFHDLI